MIRSIPCLLTRLALPACCVAVAHSLGAQPPGPRFPIVPEWRIRAEDHEFAHISQLYVSPNGVTVVPIKSQNRLAFFDSTGRRTGSVGGKGAGPGEFNSVQGVVVGWKQDTMWVHDSWQRRVSYFGPNAKLLRTVADRRVDRITLPDGKKSGPGVGSYGIMAIAPDGTIFAFWNQLAQNAQQRLLGEEAYLMRLARNGSASSTLKLPVPEDERMRMSAGGNSRTLPFYFGPQVVASATGDRVAYLVSHYAPKDSGSFTVSLFKSNGDTLFVKRFAYRGVPIEKSAHDSAILAFIDTRFSEGPPDVIREFQQIANRRMPSIYSEALSIVIGQDNTVWIGQRKTPTGQIVLVLDNTGNIIGHVLVPPRSQLRRASRTHVWLTEDTQYGESNVVRYRVIGLGCGKAPC